MTLGLTKISLMQLLLFSGWIYTNQEVGMVNTTSLNLASQPLCYQALKISFYFLLENEQERDQRSVAV